MQGLKYTVDSTVFVLDDDEAVRDALLYPVRASGVNVKTYSSTEEFLHSYDALKSGCRVWDIRMPGIGGLELQKRLDAKAAPRITIISAHGDIPSATQAVRDGARFHSKTLHALNAAGARSGGHRNRSA
jgi:two-component system, LuxR family, response regulator FixJ